MFSILIFFDNMGRRLYDNLPVADLGPCDIFYVSNGAVIVERGSRHRTPTADIRSYGLTAESLADPDDPFRVICRCVPYKTFVGEGEDPAGAVSNLKGKMRAYFNEGLEKEGLGFVKRKLGKAPWSHTTAPTQSRAVEKAAALAKHRRKRERHRLRMKSLR